MQRRTVLMGGLALALAPDAHAAAPAVLELFTSQGCSSCPPADALLGRLARHPGIIALAWHVDYWNNLGWHDPYSSALATQRQQDYAARLHDDVYTPALVVNGARMVVGSDQAAVTTAIDATAGIPVPVALHRDSTGVIADIGAAGQPVTALVASYDPERATPIGAGENSGRTLTDYRIVRAATPLDTWDGAARRIPLPPIAAGRGAVLLVQRTDLRVIGAADLPPA